MCPSQPLILNFLSRLIQILERGEGSERKGGERDGGARGRETLRNRRQRSREIEIITLRAHRQNWLHTRWITMEFLKSGQPLSSLISWRRNLVMNGSILALNLSSRFFFAMCGMVNLRGLFEIWWIFRCWHFYYYCINPSSLLCLYYCINFVFSIILFWKNMSNELM